MTPTRDDDEPMLTEELRRFLHPRSGWLLFVLGFVSLTLLGLGWVACRTVLASLWH